MTMNARWHAAGAVRLPGARAGIRRPAPILANDVRLGEDRNEILTGSPGFVSDSL